MSHHSYPAHRLLLFPFASPPHPLNLVRNSSTSSNFLPPPLVFASPVLLMASFWFQRHVSFPAAAAFHCLLLSSLLSFLFSSHYSVFLFSTCSYLLIFTLFRFPLLSSLLFSSLHSSPHIISSLFCFTLLCPAIHSSPLPFSFLPRPTPYCSLQNLHSRHRYTTIHLVLINSLTAALPTLTHCSP